MPQKLLPKHNLGKSGPAVSAIGLGTMGMGGFYGKSDEEECLRALSYAADCGMTFWDTANIYGTSESLAHFHRSFLFIELYRRRSLG